jgi:hypothetical protein
VPDLVLTGIAVDSVAEGRQAAVICTTTKNLVNTWSTS